jgi:TolA-binding protein
VALNALTESRNTNVARQALALTGEALLRSDKRPEAGAVFTRLVKQMPDASRPDDFALSAVRGLDTLDVISAKENTLSEADHLQRANINQFNRDFDGARSHYLAVVENHPQSASVPDVLYQIGRGFTSRAGMRRRSSIATRRERVQCEFQRPRRSA